MKQSLALGALCVAASTLPVHAQTILRTLPGAAGTNFGAAVLPINDQNADGYQDVLVGAPHDYFDEGVVYCISGAYLATGTGPSTLWTCAGGGYFGTGQLFGSSLAAVGDLTGDGVPDFVVGAPNASWAGFANGGAVGLINGATHGVVAALHDTYGNAHFGACLTTVGDINGDGKAEFAVGAPGVYQQVSGAVLVISGTGFVLGQNTAYVAIGGASGGAGYGTSIASGFDLDGNGKNDVLVGAPFDSAGVVPEVGGVYVIKADTFNVFIANYFGSITGDRLGASVDASSDYDGDGVLDFVVGAPNHIGPTGGQEGRVLVLSGAKVLANTLPKELSIWDSPLYVGGFPGAANVHFGAAVRAVADLNNDGVGDILVGAPDYYVQLPAGPARGAVSVYSGATRLLIGGFGGANNDHFGDVLGGAIQDVNGDGMRDFLVAGSTSDNPMVDCGVLKCLSAFPCFWATYCTGKINSQGCTPTIGGQGNASISSAAPFLITCANVLNQKIGLLIYSHRPQAIPFQSGILCVRSPMKRMASQISGGNTTGSDCSGTFSFDFNAWLDTGNDPTLVAGSEMFSQYWSRDPWSSPSATSLSNGLRFVVGP